MPRKGRGGARVGRPGQAYSNRTDLNASPTQPIQTATGQPYGMAKQQADAQRAIPLPNAQAPVVAPQPSQPAPVPGGGPAFDGPTANPNEHVMTGAAPDNQASMLVANQVNSLGSLLSVISNQPGASPDVQYLASVFSGGRM